MKTKVIYTSLLLLLLTVIISCQKKEEIRTNNFALPIKENIEVSESETVYTDSTCKYEYRNGHAGHYQYNYDVSGEDSQGNQITGNVSMQDKYGIGVIIVADRKELEIEAEWVGNGLLQVTDAQGNEYELKVD
jgi:hypothetical protein